MAPCLARGRGAIALALAALFALVLNGCAAGRVRQARGPGLADGSRLDPALSGDGRLLASLLEREGGVRLILQEQPAGSLRAIRLRGRQPHRSPSLSWNGRYLAVLVQDGGQRRAVIEDRLTGRLLRLPLPAVSQPERLSLAPDGSRLAVQVLRGGQWRVQVFDLSRLLEPDLPPGRLVLGGGAGPP
jgi:Tol biopolymer transport system component